MSFFEWFLKIMICSQLLVFLTFGYLYILYRKRYMGIWSLCWLLHILLFNFFDLSRIAQFSSVFLLSHQLLCISMGMLTVWGAYVFLERHFSRWWLYAASALTVFHGMSINNNGTLTLKTLPTTWFVGFILIWTGVLFARCVCVHGIGRYITGGAFILLGIHYLDVPFLMFSPLVSRGLLLGVVLQVVIALGILHIYVAKIRLALISKERYYRIITENALDIIYRFQYMPKPGFEYVSPAVTDITGYKPTDFYADPELEMKITYPEDRQMLADFRNAPALTDKPVTFRMIRRDGALIWAEQRGVPIYGNNGALLAFEGIIRDITDRKRLEQDMARLEGLNAIGQMAANIAHEIRNPMTTVRGYLQLLGSKKEFGDYKDEFDLLLSELDRTNSIITEYLALSKEKLVNLTSGQLNAVIQAILPLIQADANARGKIIKTELSVNPDISMDEKEIRQIILNLVRNGLEAMDAGGILTIETRREQDAVVLAIGDQGKGIPAEILGKIGTPFFTTKESGTGLGLAVCHRIASRHRADMKLETSSAGTTFYLRFPIPGGGAQ